VAHYSRNSTVNEFSRLSIDLCDITTCVQNSITFKIIMMKLCMKILINYENKYLLDKFG